MGIWFLNFQIFTNNRNPQEVKSEVLAAYKAFLIKKQFVEVEYIVEQYYLPPGNDEYSKNYDRGIAIGYDIEKNSPWITLYDQFFENMHGPAYEEIGKYLSLALKTPVVLIYLFGGVELEMDLFADGKEVDIYNSEYSNLEREFEKEKQRGNVLIWQNYLKTIDGQALRQAWDADYFEVRENLKKATTVLGMDGYLAEQSWNPLNVSPVYDDSNFTHLAFRSIRSPLPYVTGKPIFKHLMDQRRFVRNFEVGDAINILNETAKNEGGPGKGLRVILWGEAVSQGIIEVESVRVAGHGYIHPDYAKPGDKAYPTIKLDKGFNKDGIMLLYGEVPDFEIQANLPIDNYELDHLNSEDYNRSSNAQIDIFPVGRASKPGKGELNIAVQELGATNPLQWSGGLATVNVLEPIGFAEETLIVKSDDTTPELLRSLKSTDKICALIMLGPNATLNNSYVAASIEKIMMLFATTDRRKKGKLTYWPETKRKIQQLGVMVDSFKYPLPRSNWTKLRNTLAICEKLACTVGVDHANPVLLDNIKNRGYGFEYNRNSNYSLHEKKEISTPPVQTLIFWKDVAGISDIETQNIEHNLYTELNSLIDKTGSYQGFVARWSWGYSPTYYSTQTLYERAKGIGNSSDFSYDSAWNSRWLRAVTDTVWIGENLAGKLKQWLSKNPLNMALLQQVAEISNVGPGLRLTLKQAATLRSLDEVLIKAGIVPSKEIWQKAKELTENE